MILPVSIATTAACTLLYLVLSLRVVQARRHTRYAVGGTGDADLQVRIRTQGNFAEYVPLALLFMALLELAAAPSLLLQTLGAVLFAARVSHAVGLPRPAPNLLRVFGVVGTFGTLLVESGTAVYLLVA